MKNVIFKGSGVAIVTPMQTDGTINYPKLRELIDWQIENGTDSIVICGTTGESSTMSDDEHTSVIAAAVEYTAGRVPVIAGAGSNDTSYSVFLSKEAAAAGADALLHVSPYYNKTSQRGLVRHFMTIADATPLPVILYNVPSRTGMNILPTTCLALSQHPNIVAIKEASGNISQIAEIAALCGEDLHIYSGNDDQILPLLAFGSMGVISVLANVLPRETHDICRLFFEGDVAGSRALQLRLLPLINALFLDVNPIPVKAALNLLGYDVGACRLPLCDMTEEGLSHLKDKLTALSSHI